MRDAPCPAPCPGPLSPSSCADPLSSFCPAVFLGVSHLLSYQVRTTSLCVQWQPQRHASTYRLLTESLPSECHLTLQASPPTLTGTPGGRAPHSQG